MARRRGDEFEDSAVFHEIQGILGRRVRRLRMEREMTQRQLSAVAEVSGPHLGFIEAGVGNVSLLVLAKLAQAFGVSVPDLFEGTSGGRTGVESTLARLAATVERIEQHLERRRDEFARFADDLDECLKQYREAMEKTAAAERAAGVEPLPKPRRVRRTKRSQERLDGD